MKPIAVAKQRIDIVDMLRGFSLLGIILAHFCNQYYAGAEPPGHEHFNVQNGLDQGLQLFHDIFIFGKFYTIFSFLFGLSFAIQLLNAKEKGQSFIGRFAWRLILLFAIGFLHQLFYRGDILTIYAVLGFILLLFHKAGNKVLLIVSFFFLFNGPGIILRTIEFVRISNQPAQTQTLQPAAIDTTQSRLQDEATVYYNLVKQGDFKHIARLNISKEFQVKLEFQVFSGRLFVTLGLFLLGLYMGRNKVFENLAQYRKKIKKWFWISVAVSIFALVIYGVFGESLFRSFNIYSLLASALIDIHYVSFSMVYAGGFLLLAQRARAGNFLAGLAPLGRMGLTTYLVQTIFGLLLFYGYGFNQLGEIGNSISFAAGIIFFICQVYISKWWMKNYHYGPFEWIWRSLTYFQVQPWRKKINSPG
ncbi:MAG: DUF418 domain-containing protein [Chitinophagaceae bacterium]|nr:DUF418 domain-containing protein [Chitinophagaceae bacterium]